FSANIIFPATEDDHVPRAPPEGARGEAAEPESESARPRGPKAPGTPPEGGCPNQAVRPAPPAARPERLPEAAPRSLSASSGATRPETARTSEGSRSGSPSTTS